MLEYKAGECGETEDTETMCDISPDTALNTMVRVDGDNIPCPIQVFDDARSHLVHVLDHLNMYLDELYVYLQVENLNLNDLYIYKCTCILSSTCTELA